MRIQKAGDTLSVWPGHGALSSYFGCVPTVNETQRAFRDFEVKLIANNNIKTKLLKHRCGQDP